MEDPYLKVARVIHGFIRDAPENIALRMEACPPILPILSSDILKRLLSCQRDVNDTIIPAINDCQGYGYDTPQGTIKAWDDIKEGLDYLCERWKHAVRELKHPTNRFSNPKVGDLVKELAGALDCEFQHVMALKDNIEPTTARRRHAIYLRYRPYVHSKSIPESKAYNALLSVHRYAKERGWTTDEGFGKALGDGEAKPIESLWPMYSKHFTVEEGVMVAKDTGTRIPHH